MSDLDGYGGAGPGKGRPGWRFFRRASVFSRQAVSRPAQQAPRPQQNRTAEAPERTETKRDIDQGIDPKDYGKRNTGNTAAGTGTAQNSGAVKNNFSGGTGGFSAAFRCGRGFGSAVTAQLPLPTATRRKRRKRKVFRHARPLV